MSWSPCRCTPYPRSCAPTCCGACAQRWACQWKRGARSAFLWPWSQLRSAQPPLYPVAAPHMPCYTALLTLKVDMLVRSAAPPIAWSTALNDSRRLLAFCTQCHGGGCSRWWQGSIYKSAATTHQWRQAGASPAADQCTDAHGIFYLCQMCTIHHFLYCYSCRLRRTASSWPASMSFLWSRRRRGVLPPGLLGCATSARSYARWAVNS